MKPLRTYCLASCVLAALLGGPAAMAAPSTSHPRLWLTPALTQQLQQRATPANPFYQDGVRKLAAEYKAKMDSGELYLLDNGDPWNGVDVGYDIAGGAEVFAFMSLIEQNAQARADYGQRARSLAMYIIDRVLTPAEGMYFHYPIFATDYRGNFEGEAIPLALDWAYGYFSAEDKHKIAKVFMRWIGYNLTATTSGQDHPEPVGVVNDPILFQDKGRLRTALNNFSASHMRNITLMALALDPADELSPAEYGADNKLATMGVAGYDTLRDYIKNATGAWLYTVDEALTRYAGGGVPVEGFEYNSASTAHMAETYLALHTAGYDEPAIYGAQVVPSSNAFWDEVTPAFFHLISPKPGVIPAFSWIGDLYQPANYGDIENYFANDFMSLFGPLGVYDLLHGGNSARLDAIRWIEKHAAPGGAARLMYRASDRIYSRNTLFYYILFTPDMAEPAHPSPQLPTFQAAHGMNSLTSRTNWDADAAWLSYMLPWNNVDHQQGTGNMFQFWRGGEWITKERSGYGYVAGLSSFKNTLAIENNAPGGNLDWVYLAHQHGAQPAYVAAGDPSLIAYSNGADFTYVSGDATNLYNADYRFSANDVQEARRSVFWLKPDVAVIYDRARTATDGRYKQFWLNFTAQPQVQGNRASLTTPGGQAVALDTLLPAAAQPQVDTTKPLRNPNEPDPSLQGDETATGEAAQWRIRVDAPGNPADATFLHVLQAGDNGAVLPAPQRVTDDAAVGFQGAVLADNLVLFAADIRNKPSQAHYHAPQSATRHYLTGIDPDQTYSVSVAANNGQWAVSVTPAAQGAFVPDDGGVLAFTVDGGGAAPVNGSTDAWFTNEDLAAIGTPDPAPLWYGGNGGNGGGNGGGSVPPANVDGHLASLAISGLSPAFDPLQNSYTVSVADGTCSVPVTATLADPSLKLQIQSTDTASGTSRNAYVCGGNTIDIVVYAGWSEVGRYTVTPQFVPAAPPPAQPPVATGPLSALSIAGLSPAFAPNVTQYTIPKPASGSVAVTATLADPTQQLYIQSNATPSGQTRNAWVGDGKKIDIVVYKNWNEVGRYTVTPQ
jgi:hypothetical protein